MRVRNEVGREMLSCIWSTENHSCQISPALCIFGSIRPLLLPHIHSSNRDVRRFFEAQAWELGRGALPDVPSEPPWSILPFHHHNSLRSPKRWRNRRRLCGPLSTRFPEHREYRQRNARDPCPQPASRNKFRDQLRHASPERTSSHWHSGGPSRRLRKPRVGIVQG